MCVCVCDAVTEFERVLRWILSEGASVNLYMFHGGTNFGFLAGANDRLNPTNESYIIDYSPVVTSYGSSLIALCVISHLMTDFTVWRRCVDENVVNGTYLPPIRGATTFSKLGVQFLGRCYCTEQNTDGIPSFVHCYVKSWGVPSNF